MERGSVRRDGAVILGVTALVAVSCAWALGAWAIAYLVIRRARVGRLEIRDLTIDHLQVGRLDVSEDDRGRSTGIPTGH